MPMVKFTEAEADQILHALRSSRSHVQQLQLEIDRLRIALDNIAQGTTPWISEQYNHAYHLKVYADDTLRGGR